MPTIQVDPIDPNVTYSIPTQAELDAAAAAQAAAQTTPAYYASVFSLDTFCGALLVAFGADANVLPYYSVLKDLAAFKNFAGMYQMAQGLLASGKITQDELNTLNTVLAQQNIVLSNYVGS